MRDLETVVDAARLERFALLGLSQGGAIAISYAVRHPERVAHLVLHGAFARGSFRRNPTPRQRKEAEGKNVAPQNVEDMFGRDPYVEP